MDQTLTSLVVTSSTTLQDILKKFESSKFDLILIDQTSVIAQPHLDLLSDYPRSVSAALVAKIKKGDTFIRQNRVASASSESHQVTFSNSYFLGALRLSQQQRDEIIEALSRASSYNLPGNALDLALVALVRATIEVSAASVWAAPYTRTTNETERNRVKEEIDLLKPDNIRLQMANRSNDGFFSVFVLRKFSKLITKLAVKINITPNQVTTLSLGIGLYSAYLFARGSFWSILMGALVFQLSIIIDCVDGELARYTRRFSELGRWLDAVTDRVKEYMALLGLAYGAWGTGKDLWLLATVVMMVQTVRHLSDYNFTYLSNITMKETFKTTINFTDKFDGIIKTERDPREGVRYWLSKIIQFPIGERWLVISVTSVIGGALLTFISMLFFAFISALVVIRGRFKLSNKLIKNQLKTNLISDQSDLLTTKKSLLIRFNWLEPSLLRIIEFVMILILVTWKDLIGIEVFIILFSICFHHYDNLYRAMQENKKPDWLKCLGLWVEGRILIIGLIVMAGWSLWWLAWYFGLLFLGISSIQWVIYRHTNKVRQ